MTSVYAILGWPVAHSRSPAMHNAAFRALGLDAIYVPLPVEPARLPQAVDGLRALGLCGVNVTVPHKQAIMPLLDQVDPGARAIGAVNTVVRDGERLLGLNTDAEGLARSLQQANVTLQGARVCVLGAGGAARAAVVGLAQAGASSVTVAARDRRRGEQLAAEVAAAAARAELAACDMGHGLRDVLGATDLLIQATSATLGEGDGPAEFAASLPLTALSAHAVVCDLVYKPRVTTVMQLAAQRGLRTVDGLGMLLHQGALAFERWTGRDAPLQVMAEALAG